MIPLYTALGALFICGIYLLATFKKETPLDKPFKLIIIFAVAFCLTTFALSCEGPANTNAEYEQLMLYYDLVAESEDEAVRFDFYNRIQNWNENYIDWYETDNSKWTDWCVGDNKYSNDVGLIDFELRRD